MDLNTGMNNKDPESRRLENLFGEALGDLPTPGETEAAWDAFLGHRRQVRRRRLWLSATGVAAVVALLLVIWLPGYRQSAEIEVFTSVDSPRELTFAERVGTIIASTPPAATTTILLSDGTRVELCANSQLEYPKEFTDTLRLVTLTGKARFDVAKHPSRPFIVSTGRLQTRVLGTVFDIDAYAHHAPLVTLYEGRVQVSDLAHKHTQDIHPGEQATLDSRGTIQRATTAVTAQEGWMNGEFFFDNVELVSVMQEIGSWYNISVIFRSRELLKERIYFRVDRQFPVDRTIEALNDLGIAWFEIKDDKMVVSLK